jgi:hypothetical protein
MSSSPSLVDALFHSDYDSEAHPVSSDSESPEGSDKESLSAPEEPTLLTAQDREAEKEIDLVLDQLQTEA